MFFKWKLKENELLKKAHNQPKSYKFTAKHQFSRNAMILNPSWLLNHQIIEVNDTVFRIHHVNRLCECMHTPTYAHTDTHIQSYMINATWLSDSSFVSLTFLISFTRTDTHRERETVMQKDSIFLLIVGLFFHPACKWKTERAKLIKLIIKKQCILVYCFLNLEFK